MASHPAPVDQSARSSATGRRSFPSGEAGHSVVMNTVRAEKPKRFHQRAIDKKKKMLTEGRTPSPSHITKEERAYASTKQKSYEEPRAPTAGGKVAGSEKEAKEKAKQARKEYAQTRKR
jgi:hypothetical protein